PTRILPARPRPEVGAFRASASRAGRAGRHHSHSSRVLPSFDTAFLCRWMVRESSRRTTFDRESPCAAPAGPTPKASGHNGKAGSRAAPHRSSHGGCAHRYRRCDAIGCPQTARWRPTLTTAELTVSLPYLGRIHLMSTRVPRLAAGCIAALIIGAACSTHHRADTAARRASNTRPAEPGTTASSEPSLHPVTSSVAGAPTTDPNQAEAPAAPSTGAATKPAAAVVDETVALSASLTGESEIPNP